MVNKKRLVISIFLAIFLLGLTGSTLMLPIVHLVAKDSNLNIIFEGDVSVLQYTKEAVFINTDAFDVFFNASGPMWIAIAAIMFGFLVVAVSAVAFIVTVIEIIMSASKKAVLKKNVISKKLSLFAGFFSLFVFAFCIISFLLTTSMSNDYVVFNPYLQCLAGTVLSLLVIIFSFSGSKSEYPQQSNKMRDALGFLFTLIFTCAAIALFIVPQYNEYFAYGKPTSFWTVGKMAVDIPYQELPVYGDYALGFAQWAMMLAAFVAVFIVLYSFIGFIMVLCGKKANWLSVHVKRWSILFLIVYFILYLLEVCSVAVLTTSFVIGKTKTVILPLAYGAIFVPFLPVIFSNMIAKNQKASAKAEVNEEPKEEATQEPAEIPEEETIENSTQEPLESPEQEQMQVLTQEPTEEPIQEQTIESPAQEQADEIAERSSEELVEEVKEPPKKKVGRKPKAKEQADALAEDKSEPIATPAEANETSIIKLSEVLTEEQADEPIAETSEKKAIKRGAKKPKDQ